MSRITDIGEVEGENKTRSSGAQGTRKRLQERHHACTRCWEKRPWHVKCPHSGAPEF